MPPSNGRDMTLTVITSSVRRRAQVRKPPRMELAVNTRYARPVDMFVSHEQRVSVFRMATEELKSFRQIAAHHKITERAVQQIMIAEWRKRAADREAAAYRAGRNSLLPPAGAMRGRAA